MTTSTSSLPSGTLTAAPSTSALSSTVNGAVKTDITKALTAAGLGAYASSQQASDLIGKISQDAVSALQSPSSQGAAASLSKIISSDIGSVLNQYGMGAYAASTQMADLTKGLASDVMSAAQSAGYSEAVATPVVTQASTPSSAAGSALASASASASPSAAVPAAATSNPTTAADPSSFNAASTVALILKALEPLTGTAVNASSLVGKLANAFSRSHAVGDVGSVMSSVAASLQQTQATVAAAKASTVSAPSSSIAGPAGSSASTAKLSTAPSSLQTGAQSASATLASMLAQNESSQQTVTLGLASVISFTSKNNPLALAYASN